jgi:hypothetical protein
VQIDQDGLLRTFRDYAGNLPSGMIPIGRDHAGQSICIAAEDSAMEGVFVMHDEEDGTSVELVRLADSFEEFIDSLSYPLKGTDWIEEMGELGTEADLDEFLHAGGLIDSISRNALSILEEAAKNGNIRLVRAARRRGASFRDALHLAIENREIGIVEFLLLDGADPNRVSAEGVTPIASCHGEDCLTTLLKKFGAQEPVEEGRTETTRQGDKDK